MKLLPVNSSDIENWWESIQPLMASFYERAKGRYNPEHIRDKFDNGYWQLWIIIDGHIIKGVIATHIIQYPNLDDMRIIMMVGEDHKTWIHLIESLEGYARDLGCAKLTGDARPGWEKILTPLGYEKTHVYLEKDL